ncbi:type III secretion system export apparatus subunit SctV [Erwinia sp. 198]|uniref:type III secretion system export apparatus subunit SctV n=1 Tax=Erwinia sp. 198 TaxID=2022746 RepID=UPI000F67C26A|nr:type III secretion system export apparatus subunit SctV [Erwinia sp. 198]RRZ93708.1 EscV/YscV/HrcV family type III secretion system export apparatus protein [Erwinia sp. 198]
MNNLFLILNRIALAAMQRSEIIGAMFALAIVFMLIIPLPLGLIDALIAVNICLSSLLVVLAMYLPKPLAFSSFPAVLLLTTMFRLALSISTTRQILVQQDAGHIVAAFGTFVVGGNLAVGMVMFLILTVVNFLVITKGSERVAEVAARFTLDAMPGKQMSIDSDLRAGIIDVNTAKRKRVDLAKESQLFGAMDGAMKFVKGDAIAGLVILFINLIGGFSIGVMQLGMPAGDAMHTYSVLTIGDGLIAQIPALLISLTAGMIITRVSSDGDSSMDNNIGREIAEQLTSQPKAWIFSSLGMFGFALLPGMPTGVFIVLALLTLASGSFQVWRTKRELVASQPQMENEVIPPELNGTEDLRQFNPTRPYLLQFPANARGTAETLELVQAIRRLRNSIVYNYGFTLPAFDIEFQEQQPADEFRYSVYEIPRVIGTFGVTTPAVSRSEHEALAGQEGVQPGTEARKETTLLWLPADHAVLQDENVPRWGFHELLMKRMENAIHASAPNFIGLQETRALMGWLESEQPELAQELQRVMPIARFSNVLQNLVAERIPLRSVRAIAEALIEHGQHERDISLLTDLVRISLKEHICYQYAQDDGLHVWLLTPEMEEQLRDALRQTQNEVFFALPQEQTMAILTQLRSAFMPEQRALAVLLVAQDLRSPLRGLIQDEFHQVPVLSFAELQTNLAINVVGRLELEEGIDAFDA